MEDVDKAGMVHMAEAYSPDRIEWDWTGAAQGIGAAIAFVFVIIGWIIQKLSGRDLLG
ncbi:MAG: hypothetical protein ACYC7J_14170 [Syntrophales bacterium]